MDKSNHVKTWKDAKKAFEVATQSKKPAPKTIKILGMTIEKGSGVEKALSDFDAAVNKGHRKDAALSYTKAWKTLGEYPYVLSEAIKQLQVDDPLIDELRQLITTLSQIAAKMPATLKELQESKGAAIDVHPFLADFEHEKAKFEKAAKSTKQAADTEKQYKLATNITACFKPLKEYTVAAGRGDAVKAKASLDQFVTLSEALEKNCGTVHNLIGGMAGYGEYPKAIKQVQELARIVRTGRCEEMRQKLTRIIQQG